MSKFISPLTDFGFKKLFGEEDSKIYLVDFLNSILENEIAYITEIRHKNTQALGQSAIDRNSIFDLYCLTKNGERILVELQNTNIV